MNCLKNETIQAFLDRELSQEFHSKVAQHLAACAKCKAKVNEYKSDLDEMKVLLNKNAPQTETIDIPMFKKPKTKQRKLFRNIVLYAAAAMIATVIGISIFIQKQHKKQEIMQKIAMQEWEMMQQASMNEQWQNKMMTITITDKNGNIVEQISTSN